MLSRLTFERLATGVFFILVATVACLMPIQSDTWWQLRGGQEFWQTGAVPLVETYSHTAAGRFWMNHEWLSEAIFYAIFRVGGLPLLTLMAVVVATAGVGITWSLMRGPMVLRLALTGLTLGTVSIAWTPRPHVFTLLLVGVCAKLMVTGRHRWLPPLFLLWANLHGGFTLGVALLGAFGLSSLTSGFSVIARRSGLIALCLLMTLLTPLGLAFWEELPASLGRLQTYNIQEWQAPTLTNPSVLPFWASLGVLGWMGYRRRQTLFDDPVDRLLTIGALLFIPLALTSLRNVPPFFVLALPAISRALRIEQSTETPVVSPGVARMHGGILGGTAVVAIGFVAIVWGTPWPRLDWAPLSPEMITAIEECDGPLYNGYNDGGYLIWFMPERKVFMDSRQDPYPVDLILRENKAQYGAEYRELFEEYGIRCAFVSSAVPLVPRLEQDGWQVRHRDARWTVLEGVP